MKILFFVNFGILILQLVLARKKNPFLALPCNLLFGWLLQGQAHFTILMPLDECCYFMEFPRWLQSFLMIPGWMLLIPGGPWMDVNAWWSQWTAQTAPHQIHRGAILQAANGQVQQGPPWCPY